MSTNNLELINKVKQSNLNNKDKEDIVRLLDTKDYSKVVSNFVTMLNLSKNIFELFDINLK